MSRKKKTILQILLVVVLFYLVGPFSGRYLTMEGLLHANERGLRYGPSTEILLKTSMDTEDEGKKYLMVGKVDDRSLSAVYGKRSLLVFYRLSGGAVPGFSTMDEGENVLLDYSRSGQMAYGLVDRNALPKAAYVRCMSTNAEDQVQEFGTFSVQENGFFTGETAAMDEYTYPDWVQVLDTEGNVLAVNERMAWMLEE